ncbi:MAG TPA: hypothetical protein VG168_16675, partial [Bryobacteraceae bacterium]|nr:hypothetical protein [Bryobacteraceae bacterium]
MIFRTAFLAAVSACLVCASDQTLGPEFGTQPANARDTALLRALKAASTESLGINRLQHLSQPTSNSMLDIVPKLPRVTEPPLLMGRAAPRSSPGIHCSIPL